VRRLEDDRTSDGQASSPDGVLSLRSGTLSLPAFLPDATQGVVRGVDAQALQDVGVQGVMMNVFHLMQRPGTTTIRALGDLHRMFSWKRPIMTDSGGFQIYSLIRENAKYGSINDRGLVYRPEGTRRRINLSPEKSIRLQMSYGADIVVCLDDCTHSSEAYSEQRESVRRTISWAKRCREEYGRRIGHMHGGEETHPLIYAVVQGGDEPDLRRECAEALLEIGFDGYGLGGWPLDSEGNLLTDTIAYLRELIPAEFPLHALGVGHPQHMVDCIRMGYDLADSSMPTRDARHGRLLVFSQQGSSLDGEWFSYLYVQDEEHVKDGRPVDPTCDCPVCQNYSRAFLHHLFKVGDSLFQRLATLHNVRFIMRLMARLREQRRGG